MRSTLEQGRSATRRRALFAVLVALMTITLHRSTPPAQVEAPKQVSQVFAAATAAEESPPARPESLSCPAGKVAIEPADIGVGEAVRCLSVGGAEVQESRVDPLYGRVAADLLERIPGRTAELAGNVKVICWSEKDSRTLSVSFSDAGKIESLKYWLGWAPKWRGVINLSYLACLQLDRIVYRNGHLALPATGAAFGTLAHETMHVGGIFDEGVADCYAMQLTGVTALGLGLQGDVAAQLRALNFEFNREHRAGTEYDSPDCYDGGPLDLAPDSPEWP